ncbi:MAG: caspase family protein [Treponema sp.]|nr:caspase family protein [Treponema sp.]
MKSGFFRYGIILFLFLFTGAFLYSAEKYALLIGNSNYRDKNIAILATPVNDVTDVAANLRTLGYNVNLKTNVGLRDMINLVKEFSVNLGRSPDNEGFFWFAGHGLSVKGIHYLLPVDVDPVDDDIISRGSYSVDDLLEEIGNARNRTNLIVIDACRNALLPGSSNRSVGSRGLSVLSPDSMRVAGNKIIYSTLAGRTAADGPPGSRNSPFAQAFLSNMMKHESFDDVFLDIANDTMRLTNGDQQPYSMGSFAVKSYSLDPQPAAPAAAQVSPSQAQASQGQPSAAAQTAPVVPSEPSAARPMPVQTAASKPADDSGFIMDGRRTMNVSAGPVLYGSTFSGKGGGLNVSFTFYEKYGSWGEFFLIPNSFFFGVDLFMDQTDMKWKSDYLESLGYNMGGIQKYSGLIWNLGTLWKIRFDKSQRLIGNFGLSLSFFTAGASLNDVDEVEIYKYDLGFDPGLGFYAGISYRVTELISLDFNFLAQISLDPKQYKGTFYDTYYNVHSLTADDLYPFTAGARLSVSFWFPK